MMTLQEAYWVLDNGPMDARRVEAQRVINEQWRKMLDMTKPLPAKD
jgi:hypothetical protein